MEDCGDQKTSDPGNLLKRTQIRFQKRQEMDQQMSFYTREKLKDYIRCQYGFYEWGIWALVEKETGQLVGKAGLTPIENEYFDGISMELGYHIFKPYRRKGLAVEACRGIISHVKETLEEPVFLYAK